MLPLLPGGLAVAATSPAANAQCAVRMAAAHPAKWVTTAASSHLSLATSETSALPGSPCALWWHLCDAQ